MPTAGSEGHNAGGCVHDAKRGLPRIPSSGQLRSEDGKSPTATRSRTRREEDPSGDGYGVSASARQGVLTLVAASLAFLVNVRYRAYKSEATITECIPRAIPTYALYVAMKPRVEQWAQSPYWAQRANVNSVPKVLKEVVWGQEVLPHVLTALYHFTGGSSTCTAREHFHFFLREDRVYHALSYVLHDYLLPSDGHMPRVPCFKAMTQVVAYHRDEMPVYVADWLQMALQAVQFALQKLSTTRC